MPTHYSMSPNLAREHEFRKAVEETIRGWPMARTDNFIAKVTDEWYVQVIKTGPDRPERISFVWQRIRGEISLNSLFY